MQGNIILLHISNLLVTQRVLAEFIRFCGTISIALMVAITSIKNTHIKTINIAAQFQIQHKTKAKGIQAIGAIGAKRRIIGNNNLLNQTEDEIKVQTNIAIKAHKDNHIITRSMLEMMDSHIVEALVHIQTLKSLSKRSFKNSEGGGKIFVCPHCIIAEYSQSAIRNPIDIIQYMSHTNFW